MNIEINAIGDYNANLVIPALDSMQYNLVEILKLLESAQKANHWVEIDEGDYVNLENGFHVRIFKHRHYDACSCNPEERQLDLFIISIKSFHSQEYISKTYEETTARAIFSQLIGGADA